MERLRNTSKSAKGVSILTQQDGYLTVEKVFDLSQTYGNKPYPLVLLTAGEDYTLETHINKEQYVVRITYLNDAASASQPAAETQPTV